MSEFMTPMQRVLTTLSHKEPDRVPFFLLLTFHGAKDLGLSIEDYFSKAEYMVQGQLRLREKYQHDCYYAFSYAALEVEAYGGEVRFIEDGPPVAGTPIIKSFSDIDNLRVPDIASTPCLQKILTVIQGLKGEAGDDVPIIGVVMSPFSAPVMQMGFAPYLDMIVDQREQFWKLMRINEQFCVAWANAQLEAGATAICYFDPVSSPSMISPQMYRETGFDIASRTIAKIAGPVATHFASGRCLDIVDDVVKTGAPLLAAGDEEDISAVKERCHGRISVIGNLNGIKMCRWTPEEARDQVKELLQGAASGGGFILSDGHGEIPWSVSEEVLSAVSETVRTHGVYQHSGAGDSPRL